MELTLDLEKDIRFDLDNPKLMHSHLIESQRGGLQHLASEMRKFEQRYIDADPHPCVGHEMYPDLSYFDPVIYCTFNWFAISLTSYLRLVALVDLVNRNNWSESDLVQHHQEVDKGCSEYVESVVPAVWQWRNKVAAHPAATAPRSNKKQKDGLGTLLQSFSCPISRTCGYFEVARVKWKVGGEVADLKPWSVTATYERLTSRFWDSYAIPRLRYRSGEEPKDEPGTWLRLVHSSR